MFAVFVSKFGYPEQLISDNGSQFTSEELATFIWKCEVKQSQGVPFWPSASCSQCNIHIKLSRFAFH